MAVAEAPGRTGASADEAALVRYMSSDGGGAAEELYRRYASRVLRFIYYRVGESLEDAEELTLDTFLNAMELCRGYDDRVSVFVWLCGIAKLRIIDFHRRRKRAKRGSGEALLSIHDLEDGLDGGANMEQLIDRLGASQVVDLALQRVSEDEREALLLQQIDGLSIREISARLRRSEDAVDSLIRRSKSKLRGIMQGLMGEEVTA